MIEKEGPKNSTQVLIAVLLAGAIVRLALWFWFDGLPPRIADELDYTSLATSLVERGEYSYTPGVPATLRPPLYPAVVAVIYQLFGVENYQAVRLFQALLSLANVLVLYRLGLEVASRRVALWLAGLYCFYPSLLGSNNLILTEVLFTFLLCSFCLVGMLAFRRESMRLLLPAGVLLGLTTLTRSVLWLFPPVLAIYFLFFWKGSLLKRLAAAGLVVAGFVLTIAPWSIRNSKIEHAFVTVDTMGGRNFMMGNYQYTPLFRSWDAISNQGEESWIYEVKLKHPEKTTQGQIDKLALRQGLEFVVGHPGLTLQRDVVKFFDFWGLERELVAGAGEGFFGPISKPVIVLLGLLIVGCYVLAFFAGLFGMIATPGIDRSACWFFLLLIAYVCGMHTLVFGHSRYHLPLMPFVLLFAASAIVQRRTIWQRRWQWRPLIATAVCLVFLVGWTWIAVAVDYDRIRALLN